MRKAFTLLELVFVIVVMGILAKFGTNILVTTYSSFAASTTNNKLLANVELTLKQIPNRLQYRIKDSVISRATPNGAFTSVANVQAGHAVLEWVGYDIDGWLGNANSTNPNWSGFIDVDNTAATAPTANGLFIVSPLSNEGNISSTIAALANGSANDIGDAAIFFTGQNSDVTTDYGYAGALNSQNFAAHTLSATSAGSTFVPGDGNFTGVDVYENYKLAWTAYAISLEDFNGDGDTYSADHPTLAGTLIRDLVFYYDYQPWNGVAKGGAGNVRRQLLLQNVDTFRYQAVGETIKLQVCVNDLDALGGNDGGYSVCEEIAIF